MTSPLELAITAVSNSRYAFFKFISANDAGTTGGHQAGFYMPKSTIPLMFEDGPGIKGTNKDRLIQIKWQNEFTTDSRFIYYGKGSRNEYRLTRFGKGFPFLKEGNVGDLFILAQPEEDEYLAYVLQTDEEIEDFLNAFNLSPTDSNQLIEKSALTIDQCFQSYIEQLTVEFPKTIALAKQARTCFNQFKQVKPTDVLKHPDAILLDWVKSEYELFRALENNRYQELIKYPLGSVDNLVAIANTVLNRRKSRAGKSLEHHLEEVFYLHQLEFATQAKTEGKKKPDFLFPNETAYQDPLFQSKQLTLLAAKTTCKDRWRQILNEAHRIPQKHLFTLQQGISKNQLIEMQKANVQLVVPKAYKIAFPKEFRPQILSLGEFIAEVKAKQNS